MPVELQGARALITGASGGIGIAIATALHARGATVVLTARRAEVLDEVKATLGDRVDTLRADLLDPDDVRALPERAGQVDVLVANAALPGSGTFDSFSEEEIDRALDVNLRAPIVLATALAPAMRERARGHVVFISSLAGKASSAGGSIYSATKFGLRGYALGMRDDLVGTGVGVTTIFPGFIRDAGMFHESGAELPRTVGTRTPEQVAAAVIKGIERNRVEIGVAPFGLKAGTALGGLAPRPSMAFQRKMGGVDIADQLAKGQADKR